MRLLCTGFHQLDAVAALAEARHDVVTVDAEALAAMWIRPRPDAWRELAPPGWEPDVALIGTPEYKLIPPYLAELPCPVALWVGDWYANAQAVHWLADQVELVLADATGVRALRSSGIDHVEELCPWTFDPRRDRPEWDREAEYDIGFIGSFNEAIQSRRNRVVWQVAQMDRRWRIRLTQGLYGENYGRFLRRSRITLNHSVTGDVNMRCFEAAACGSLVAINRGAAAEASRWFELGREIVVYDENNVAETLEHYLHHEDERRAIARAGWERVQSHGPAQRLDQLLQHLERLAERGRTIARSRDRARDGARAAAQLISTLATPPLEGAEILLEAAESADPTDAGVQLCRALLYARYGDVHPEHRVDAADWAEGHFDRARQLDPSDAAIAFGHLQFAEHVSRPRTHIAERIIAGIRAGTLVARPDRQLFPGVSAWSMEWQRIILQAPDPGPELRRVVLAAALETAGRDEPVLARRIALLEEAVTASCVRLETVAALAEALLDGRRFAEALPWVEFIQGRQPLATLAWEHRVRILVHLGRHDEARDLVERCALAAERLPVDRTIVPSLRSLIDRPEPLADAA